jgi:hypothetical protein
VEKEAVQFDKNKKINKDRSALYMVAIRILITAPPNREILGVTKSDNVMDAMEIGMRKRTSIIGGRKVKFNIKRLNIIKIKMTKNERKLRTRNKLKRVNKNRLRLSVFRSSKNIYAQMIDDNISKVIKSDFPKMVYGEDYVNLGFKSGNEGVIKVIVTDITPSNTKLNPRFT